MIVNFPEATCASNTAIARLEHESVITRKNYRSLIVMEEPDAGQLAFDGPAQSDLLPKIPPVTDAAKNTKIMEYEWTPAIALEAVRKDIAHQIATYRTHEALDRKELESAIKKIGLPIPRLWRDILIASDCDRNIGGIELPAVSRWPEDHQTFIEMLDSYIEIAGKSYLYIGNTGSGDEFALDLSEKSKVAIDAPILWWDHETTSFSTRYPSITHFLEGCFRKSE